MTLLSFQSFGCIVAFRTLNLSEIPAFMLIVILHDYVGAEDHESVTRKRREE